MRDKRPVDELSIEELERVLALRKRQARQERLRQLGDRGRRLPTNSPLDLADIPDSELSFPQQHEAAGAVPPLEPPTTYDITDDIPRFEDELEPPDPPRKEPKLQPVSPYSPSTSTPLPRQRAAWEKILLAVEVLGVLGIIAVLMIGGYLLIDENSRIEALEQKSADIQRDAEAMRPTPSPPPELQVSLSDYVLPSGHIYNRSDGEFNFSELPESIRPVAQAQLEVAPRAERSTPEPSHPGRIVIATDKVQVEASIYGGDDWYQLQKGVGHYQGSANPGEDGNMILSAHNDIYDEIFRDIQYLEPGDEIRVQAQNSQWYTYIVSEKLVVDPTDVWVLAQGNEPIVTLITCHPYRVDTQRMIVFAKLSEESS